MKPIDIVDMLKGGDRRSIGRANEAAKLAETDARVFSQLVDGMTNADPVIAMRCADAAEKASKVRPDLLASHKSQILKLLASATQSELRWHIAAMAPRLSLTHAESKIAFSHALDYTQDRSSIVKTAAMQALHDFALGDVELRQEALSRIKKLASIGTPAMKARGKKLIHSLNQ